jgi:hypothetical protein
LDNNKIEKFHFWYARVTIEIIVIMYTY